MIRMGADFSSSCSGWSIFDDDRLVDCGAVKPKGGEWYERIMDEFVAFCSIIEQYKPQEMFYEQPPLKDGKPTLLKLGAVQGMALSLCAKYNIKPIFLSPTAWRGKIGMFDGDRNTTHRDILKKKAIDIANDVFGLDLRWVAPKSKQNDDDIAEAILIAWSMVKPKKFSLKNR